MYELRGAIISLRDVLVRQGRTDGRLLAEAVQLIKFLLMRGVQPVLVSNNGWVIGDERTPIQSYLSGRVGVDLPYFQRGLNGMPPKQSSRGMAHILEKFGWAPENAIYIGSTDEDMQAARNGKLLFLNAQWHVTQSPYGFAFESPKDLARFVDCCCLGLGDWYWALEQGDLRVYSIAPLAEWSKRYPQARVYSSDAKQAVKFNRGNLLYWGRLMAARIYFSGLGAWANYVAPYPGHTTSSQSMLLLNFLRIVAGSLNAQYLEDAVVRHTKAQKSQTLRQAGHAPDHQNQLGTIHLRRDPLRTGASARRYVNPPLRRNKNILLVDDVCTQGFSLEAARAFVKSTGAQATMVTWLKTPSNDYSAIRTLDPEIKNPYEPYIPSRVFSNYHSFSGNIRNDDAPNLIGDAFARYANWEWPVT